MVRKSSNFKRMKYFAAALALVASSVPVISSGEAWAEGTGCFAVGNNLYETFAEADAAVEDGGTIALACDATANDIYAITAKNIVFDLAGYTYESTGERAFRVDGKTFTVQDSGNGGFIKAVSYGVSIYDHGTFNLYGGSIQVGEFGVVTWLGSTFNMYGGAINSGETGISGNGTDGKGNGTVINLYGGSIYGGLIGVYHPQIDGTLNIHDGVNISSAKTGVEVRSGNLNMDGGTITVPDGVSVGSSHNGSGNATTGAAIAVAQHTTKRDINVNITGGTLNAPAAFYESNPEGNTSGDLDKVTLSISGGTFNGSVSSADFNNFVTGGSFATDPGDLVDVPDGYEKYTLSSGTFVVAPASTITPVAEVKVPVDSEPVKFFEVSPAAYNEMSYEVKLSNGSDSPAGYVNITTEEEDGKLIGKITGTRDVYENITIRNNSGKIANSIVKFYKINGLEDKVIPVSDNAVEVQISSSKWNVKGTLVESSDTSVVEIVDGKLVGKSSGEAEITVEFNDTYHTRRTFEVYVYDLNEEDSVIMLKKGDNHGVIADSNWRAAATIDDDNIISAETSDGKNFEVTALGAGKTDLTLAITLNGQEITKKFTVYVVDVNNIGDQYVKAGGNIADLGIVASGVEDGVTYEVSTESDAIATIYNNAGLSGVAAGDTDIVVTFKLDGVDDQSVKVGKAHVYNFATTAANTYDKAAGDTISFTVTEGNPDHEFEFTSTNAGITSLVDGNNWTIAIDEGVIGGQETVVIVDKVNGVEVGRKTITIRIHEITVSGDTERYIALSDGVGSNNNSFTVTAREKNGFSRSNRMRVSVAGGMNGVTAVGFNGTYRITGSRAGSYEVTFTDGIASKTIYVYVLKLDFDQTTFHVKAGETAIQFVTAINEYWHDINVGAGYTDTKFISANGENIYAGSIGYTADGEKYMLGIDGVEAGDYELVFRAYANGNTEHYAEKNVTLRVYEMIPADSARYFMEVGDTETIIVKDKNTHAYTRVEVVEGNANGLTFSRRSNGDLRNYNIRARQAGEYTLRYTDYMENGQVVGTFEVKVIVINVVEETLAVLKGKTLEITGNAEYDVSYAMITENGEILTIDENENGEIVAIFDSAELEAGTYSVRLAHDFVTDPDEQYPPRHDIKLAKVLVYEVNIDSEVDPDGVVAETIESYINKLFEEGKLDDLLDQNQLFPLFDMLRILQLMSDEEAQAIFGSGLEGFESLYGLHDVLNDGASITVRVVVTPFGEDGEVNEELAALIEALDVDEVSYFDVTLVMSDGRNDFGVLHELEGEITVALMEVSDPATGYTREYVVIRDHNGEIEILDADQYYIEGNVLYVKSDRFSTYAVAYKDTLIPVAPNTGVAGEKNVGAASSNVSVIVALLAASVMVALMAAIESAKRK